MEQSSSKERSQFSRSRTGGGASEQQTSATSRHNDSKPGCGTVESFAEIAKQKLRKARLQKKKELQLKAKEEEEK
jgi:hypothetical protein